MYCADVLENNIQPKTPLAGYTDPRRGGLFGVRTDYILSGRVCFQSLVGSATRRVHAVFCEPSSASLQRCFYIMYLPTTNNGRTLWFSEHNSSIRENRFGRGKGGGRVYIYIRKKKKKTANLNNIITPSGEVACWPRALLSAPRDARPAREK